MRDGFNYHLIRYLLISSKFSTVIYTINLESIRSIDLLFNDNL